MSSESLAISGKPISALAECRALVVDEVDDEALLRGVDPDLLPVQVLKLPVEDVSLAAVLSWRWDGDLKAQGSRNVASAVRQAKKMGVRYLFVDAISINQHLAGDALIEQVMAFSTLYKTLPVIAAYDNVDEGDIERTLNRPWIFSEARLYRYNPTKIVYVGHANQGAKHDPSGDPLAKPLLGLELYRHEFGKHLGATWRGSFIETIIGVLTNEIGMSCLSDFKYIIPPCARALTAAYEKMSRNDYLLTALILCRVYAPPRTKLWSNIQPLNYDRYSFREIDSTGYSSSWTIYGIFLDGIQVGRWEHKDNFYTGDWNDFKTLADAEHVTLTALGLTDSEYREYAAQEEARRAFLVSEGEGVPLPTVEVVSITL